MKIIKRSISLLSMIILITGVYGCMNQEKDKVIKDPEEVKDQLTTNPEESKDQIIAFLEKKYGKEFVPLSIEMDRWPYQWDELSVYPKGGDKEKDGFNAYRERKDDKYLFSDSYFGVLIHDEYEQKIREIAKEYFPECKITIIFASDIFPNELTSKSTLKDLIDMNIDYNPTIKIKVAPTLKNVEQFDEEVNLFIKKVIENKLRGTNLIFYLKDNNLDVDITDDSVYQKRRGIFITHDFTASES